MASASRLQSGSYRVQVTKTIDGKKIKKSFSASPDDYAGDWRKAKSQAELMARNWQMNAEKEAHKISVKKAIDNYLAFGKESWSPSTYKDYKNMPKHFESIKDYDIRDIDDDILQKFIDDNKIKGLSPKTSRNRVNFLIASLKHAKLKPNFDIKIPEAVDPELNPPEPSEFHRLLELASPEERLTIILAGLYTLRRGEICGLYGSDLLWDINRIYVHTSVVKDEHKQWVRNLKPKTKQSVRVIDIHPEIMKLFPKVKPDEPVIKMNPDEITHHFDRLRVKAGVTCRFHDLRKYAASLRSEIMPAKYIEADGGWGKDSVVLRDVYDKPFVEKHREYSKKFNKQIFDEYKKELFGN